MPRGGGNLALSVVRKQLWMDFQAVSRLPHFRAYQEKNAYFAIKVQYPGSHLWCVPAVFKKFPDRLRFPVSFLKRKRDGTDVWMLL